MRPVEHPYKSLVLFFVLWKIWLLVIACLSPGPGYDTSTSLLFEQSPSASVLPVEGASGWQWLMRHLMSRLTRWDAVYFARISSRGYLYEQEWAFGWGFTRLVSHTAKGRRVPLLTCYYVGLTVWSGVLFLGFQRIPLLEVYVAFAIATFSHLMSVLVLYRLSELLFPRRQSAGRAISVTAACLHIISPAGLFLAAPYAESLFSFLSFSAFGLYAEGSLAYLSGHAAKGSWATLGSGAVFGLATTVRSNGLLGGSLFLFDAAILLKAFIGSPDFLKFRKLIISCLGGSLVACGAIWPQYIAYDEYCNANVAGYTPRPWCKSTLPSVYTWVQNHYW